MRIHCDDSQRFDCEIEFSSKETITPEMLAAWDHVGNCELVFHTSERRDNNE